MKEYNWRKIRRTIAVVLALAILAYNMPRITMKAHAVDDEPVVKTDLSTLSVAFSTSGTEFVYSGEEIKPEVTVTDGENVFNPATTENFTVTYLAKEGSDENFINVGEYTATVTADDENETYTGSYMLEYAIVPVALIGENDTISFASNSSEYDAQIVELSSLTVLRNGVELPREEYSIEVIEKGDEEYSGSIQEVGSYKVKVSAAGNLQGEATLTYTVSAINLNDQNVIISIVPDKDIYSNNVTNPSVSIQYNGKEDVVFEEGTDYEIAYPDAYSLGNNSITISPLNRRLSGEDRSLTWELENYSEISGQNVTISNINENAAWFLIQATSKVYYKDAITEFRITPNDGYVVKNESVQNGTLVNGVVTPEEGAASVGFILADENGRVNNVTISFTQDMESPQLEVSQELVNEYLDASEVIWVSEETNVTVEAADNTSGVNKVCYQKEGSETEVSISLDTDGKASLLLEQGATYTFTVEDYVGRKANKSITVAMVDETLPIITVLANGKAVTDGSAVYFTMEELNEGKITFEAEASDDETGILSTTFADEFVIDDIEVGQQQEFIFSAKNNVKQEATLTFTVVYDPSSPELSDFEKNVNEDKSVELSIICQDENIDTVELIADGDYVGDDAIITPNHDGDKYTWIITINEDQYHKADYYVRATDKAGNVTETRSTISDDEEVENDEQNDDDQDGDASEEETVVEIQTVEIDKQKPVISKFLINGQEEYDHNSWFNSDVEFLLEGHDGYNDDQDGNIVLMYSTIKEAEDASWNVVEGISSENEGQIVYRLCFTESNDGFAGTYFFKLRDKAGNISEEMKSAYVKKDKVAPDSENIYVAYRLDEVENSDDNIQAFVSGTQEYLYAHSKITVRLYVKDNLSGVASVNCEYRANHVNAGQTSQVTCTVPQKLQGSAVIGDNTYDVFEFEIKNNSGAAISLDGSLILHQMTDDAGNKSNQQEEATELKQGTMILVMDNSVPVLSVNYQDKANNIQREEKNIKYYSYDLCTEVDGRKTVNIELTFTDDYIGQLNQNQYPRFWLYENGQNKANLAQNYDYTWTQMDKCLILTLKIPFDTTHNKETEYYIKATYTDQSHNVLTMAEDAFSSFDITKGEYVSGKFVLDASTPVLESYRMNLTDYQKDGDIIVIPNDIENVDLMFTVKEQGKYSDAKWFQENADVKLFDYITKKEIKSFSGADIIVENDADDNANRSYKIVLKTNQFQTEKLFLQISYKDKANNVMTAGDDLENGTFKNGIFTSDPFIIDNTAPTLEVDYPDVPQNSESEDDYRYYNGSNEDASSEKVRIAIKEASFLNNLYESEEGVYSVRYPEIVVKTRNTPSEDTSLGFRSVTNDDQVKIEWGEYDEDTQIIEAFVIVPYGTDENGNEIEYKITVSYQDASNNGLVLDQTFKNSDINSGFKKECADGNYVGGILVLDNRNPVLNDCIIAGDFADRKTGADGKTIRTIKYNPDDDGKQKVTVTFEVNDAYWNADRSELYLVRENGEKKLIETSVWSKEDGTNIGTYSFDYAVLNTGIYHLEFSYNDKATNEMLVAINDSEELKSGEMEAGKFVSAPFIMDNTAPQIEVSYNTAYRQIKDGADDEMYKTPITGYAAYYGMAEEMIEVTVKVTEHFATEEYEDGVLKGLDGFTCKDALGAIPANSITWIVEDGETDSDPKTYIGKFVFTKEAKYQFEISYSDVASNCFGLKDTTMGNSLENNQLSDDGKYVSIFMVLDVTEPELKACYQNFEKNPISARTLYQYANGDTRYYFKQKDATDDEAAVNGGLMINITVVDQNVRICDLVSTDKTRYVGLEGWDYNRLAGSFTPDELTKINDSTVSTAQVIAGLNDKREVKDDGNGISVDIPIKVEANYSFPLGFEDLAGNKVKYVDSTPENMLVTWDTTEPKIETTWAVGDNHYNAVRFNKEGWTFAQNTLTINTVATDEIAGVYSIQYEVRYLDDKGQTVVLTAESRPDLCDHKATNPVAVKNTSITIPINATYFKGTVKTIVYDYSKNMKSQNRDHITEDANTFNSNSYIAINTSTQPSRVVNGVSFYNTDIGFSIDIREGFSGIRGYAYKAGGQEEKTGNLNSDFINNTNPEVDIFAAEGSATENSDIKYTHSISDILSAGINNQNNVVITASFVSNTDFTRTTSATYNIDVTAPTIQVTYDNNSPAHDVYYKDPRTATVVITERNFDQNDVEFSITNTDGVMPRITDWVKQGSGDATTYTCQVIFDHDGDYTFTLAFQDMAGNKADYTRVDTFTIDRTIPTYTVTYDNNNYLNGYYFDAIRTATIDVLEHNFDASLILISATKNGRAYNPSYTWRRNGDHAVAIIEYTEDAEYTFTIEGRDLADNQMAAYSRDHFVIDTVDPEVEITNVQDRSANNGEVKPIVEYSDINLDKEKVDVLLSGVHNGAINLDAVTTATDAGAQMAFSDFERVPGMDDIYSLNVTVYDLAGNHSDASIMFSVNRFGSVYTSDDWLKELLEKVYTNDITDDISITETNVDTLVQSSISLNVDGDLRPLTAGTDYIVHESGSDVSWKQYTYQILASNFAQEGHYVIILASKDRATNSSDNASKDMQIEFVVDKTKPSVVVTGIEDNGRYRESTRNVTIDVRDSAPLSLVSVYLNGNRTDYDAQKLLDNDGKIDLVIDASNSMQSLAITVTDAAGNVYAYPNDDKNFNENKDEVRFLITANLLVQYYMNKPLFFGSIGGFIVVIGGIAFLIISGKKKRRKDERRKMIDDM